MPNIAKIEKKSQPLPSRYAMNQLKAGPMSIMDYAKALPTPAQQSPNFMQNLRPSKGNA
jgi:hypothetical protein